MKKINFLALLLSVALTICMGTDMSFAQPLDVNIPIRERKDPQKTGKPKSPAFVPMEAYYISNMNTVAITFMRDLGPAEFEIRNLSTGEYLEGSVQTCIGTSMLGISGTSGYYMIRFIMSNGTEYVGEFEIVD